jgi:hypothetical protein
VRVGDVDVDRGRIAAHLDPLGQPRQHPDPPAAVERAGGLELELRAEQGVEEGEGVPVRDHPVVVRDNPEQLAGVLAQVGPVAQAVRRLGRDELRPVDAAEVIGPLGPAHHEHVALAHPPAEAGLRSSIERG